MKMRSRINWARLGEIKLTDRQRKVVDYLGWANRPLTDRQISIGMGFDDPNQVRPRITELIQMNALEEVGRVKDKHTGAGCRTVRVKAAILESNQSDLF